jgi:hypothetical protein
LRIFDAANLIEKRQRPGALLAKIRTFDVACLTPDASPQEQGTWTAYSLEQP